MGDIIYCLPSLEAYCTRNNCEIVFFLHLNQPARYAAGIKHPMGNVMMNEGAYHFLKPYLESFDFIHSVHQYNGQPLDYNLDEFRNMYWDYSRGDIKRWLGLRFPEFQLGGNYFLESVPCRGTVWPRDIQRIVINRTNRYLSPYADYSILNKSKYPLVFIGLPDEYESLLKVLPNMTYHKVKDAREASDYILHSQLFIGNQSTMFALADVADHPRILEVTPNAPNVILRGNSHDFLYQDAFQFLLKQTGAI